ncbi:hypothetical protein [Stieleria maiorica]|uniref:hypothetical protein n=1 Tax=Stieleria maiorica TaxID=2795974 RepID=UPI0011CA43BC|nr:hypothetical protein [Stieleria maiorica]
MSSDLWGRIVKVLQEEYVFVAVTVSSLLTGLSAAAIAWNELFLAAPQAPELMLVISVFLAFGVAISIWRKKIKRSGTGGTRVLEHLPLRVRLLALSFAMGWSVAACSIWYVALRTPADIREQVKIHVDLGDVHHELGRSRLALEQYRVAQSIHPRNRQVLSRIQRIQTQLGE